jgi:soluble lytic murein transglycosylase
MIFMLAILFCLPVYAGETDYGEYLRRGKEELENRKYEEAIASLSKAAKEIPLLGDYALLWLSDAYHENGNHEESLKTIRSLIKKYPGSALERKARIREIKEAGEVSEDNMCRLFESYLKDYPGDMEIKYFYGGWLKKNGEKERAKKIFKEIYVNANSFSGLSYGELDPYDISTEDLIKRASNLSNVIMDYKGAEAALRTALAKDEGDMRKRILTELGHSLFNQKRYPEAAEIYKQADEKYREMRSRYRAREKDIINASIDELLKAGDKRMASVLIAVASDRRRDGNAEGAIDLFQKVIENYPTENEDALWGIGWSYFLAGEYKKASDIFTKLYNTYEDTKYLYWKGRSLDATGEDASNIFSKIAEKKRDFYGAVSYGKTAYGKTVDAAGRSSLNKYKTVIRGKSMAGKRIERIDSLLELGLLKEAVSEIIHVSNKTTSIDDMEYICAKLQELGQYKHSVRLAVKVRSARELNQFLYPLAHWDIVEGLSEKFGIDPFLVLAVVREESRFDEEARSSAGAMGLMQLMPGTAYRFDKKLRLGIKSSHDIFDVKNNLSIGALYLGNLVKEFGSYATAIASYNAGEEVVRKWLKTGRYKSADEFIEDIPYLETRNYVKRVLTTFVEYKRLFSSGDVIIDIPIEKL